MHDTTIRMATLEDFLEAPFPTGQHVRLSVFGPVTAESLADVQAKVLLLYRPREYVRACHM